MAKAIASYKRISQKYRANPLEVNNDSRANKERKKPPMRRENKNYPKARRKAYGL